MAHVIPEHHTSGIGNCAQERQAYLSHEQSNVRFVLLFYLINYGFEVYSDQCVGDNRSGKEHRPVVMDLLQKMIFPELNREPMIDSIIRRCWYSEYETVAESTADTESLCGMGSEASRGKIEGVKCLTSISADDFSSRRKLYGFDKAMRGRKLRPFADFASRVGLEYFAAAMTNSDIAL
ncbi:hypothetical protein RJZ57_002317 [Blastomyces gilchristii]